MSENPERATAALLQMLLNRLGGEIMEHLAAAGFTDARPSHGNVMEHLIHHDGLRLSSLAERAGITPQSMGELVDTLEELGYVERRPDPTDRRAKLVFLAPRGRAGMAASHAAVASQESALRELLGDSEYRHLRTLLRRAVDGTEPEVSVRPSPPFGDR